MMEDYRTTMILNGSPSRKRDQFDSDLVTPFIRRNPLEQKSKDLPDVPLSQSHNFIADTKSLQLQEQS